MKKPDLRLKKWVKILLIIVAAVLLLLAMLPLVISPVAKGYVNSHGKELVGREMNVEKLRINLLGGRVRIYDFTIFEDDDTTSFVTFDTLDVKVKLHKLIGHELYVKHLILAGPRVSLIQNGSEFNFNSIIDHFASDDEEDDDDEEESESPWKLGFYNIRLSNGDIYYTDHKMGSEWDVRNLNIKIPGVYFDGRNDTDAGLDLQLADGGMLHTEASLNMDNNDFDVLLALRKVSVANAKAYLSGVMRIGQLDGTLTTDLTAKGNLSEILKMDIAGTVSIDDLNAKDMEGNTFGAFQSLKVEVKQINIDENLYDFNSAILTGLTGHFDRFSDGNNYTRMLVPHTKKDAEEEFVVEEKPAVEADSAAAKVSKPFRLRVGQFAIVDANVSYNDYTLPEPFLFPVTDLNISAENVTIGGENSAQLRASLPHGGQLSVRWKGNLDHWKEYQRLSLNIKNLQMKDLSPYSVAYLGHPFTAGTFSFSSENTIRNSNLNGNNKLDLYNPTVGNKRKDVDAQVDIPLKAALYVLKDKDNKVDIAVPVAGNIDSPEFNYMKIVWKTLGNLLVKVASSPLRWMSDGDANMDFLSCDPLTCNFTSEQYDMLSKIASFLQMDEQIVLTLTPQMDIAAEAHAQSLFNLKRDYYLSLHSDKNAEHLEQIDYTNIEAVTLKTDGFQSYLQSRNGGLRVTDKNLQQLAEQLYPLEDSQQQLRQQTQARNAFLQRYFVNQMGVNANQIRFEELEEGTSSSGYSITSELIEDEKSDNNNTIE